MKQTRPIHEIAREIAEDWRKMKGGIWFGARPYLTAMHNLSTLDDRYGVETASTIISYFLSNAAYWRGETARRIKKELRAMLEKEDRT